MGRKDMIASLAYSSVAVILRSGERMQYDKSGSKQEPELECDVWTFVWQETKSGKKPGGQETEWAAFYRRKSQLDRIRAGLRFP